MNQTISFTQGAQISTISVSDRLCFAIQPFVQEIFNYLVELKNFKQAILQAANKHKKIADIFFYIDNNPLIALLFNNTKYPPFLGKHGVEILEDAAILPEIKKLFYLCGQSKNTYQEISQQISDPAILLLDKWIKWRIVQEQPPHRNINYQNSPGVIRLQHASLLYRSNTTGILVDPHLHSNYGLPFLKDDITRAKLEGLVDAILISHE